jgi:hypothetical protein
MLRIELYARKRLSGLSDASVIVHCPYGYTTDYIMLAICSSHESDGESHFVVFPIVWVRCIVHSNPEILSTGKEKVTIV